MTTRPLFIVLFALAISALAAVAQDAPLRPGDSLDLKIGGVPSDDAVNVTGAYVVDNSGQINLSYIGKVSVGGKTASQAADAIQNAYKSAQIYSNPTIMINAQTVARFINVSGEVKSPGRVPFTPDLTVYRAITASGGFSDFAERSKVRLLRGNDVMVIDARKILKDPSLDIPVRPGDQVIVPQSFW